MVCHILLHTLIAALSLFNLVFAAPLSPSEPLKWLTGFPEHVPADTTVRIHWTGGDGNGVSIHAVTADLYSFQETLAVISSNTTSEWVEWKTPSFDYLGNQTISLRIQDGSHSSQLYSPPMHLIPSQKPSYTSFMTFYADPISMEDVVSHFDSSISVLFNPSHLVDGQDGGVIRSWGLDDMESRSNIMVSDEYW